jgi:outer membrane protein
MSSSKTITTFCILALISSPAFAYDITDAINATLANNIQLKNSYISLQSARLNRGSAASNFLPSIGVQTTTSRTYVDGMKAQVGTPSQNALSVSEEIFSGGKGIYDLKSSKFSSEAAMIQYQDEIDRAIVQTVQVYQNVIASRETYNVSQQKVETLRKTVKQSEVKLAVGAITRTNILEAQAKLAGAISDRERAYSDMRNAEEKFKYFTGDIAPKSMSDIDISSISFPKDHDTFLELVERNSPLITAAEKNLMATKYQTKSTKAMFLPTITASASVVGQSSWQRDIIGQTTKQHSDANTYQLSFQIPIFQKGLEYVKVKKALLDEETAANKKHDTILKIRQDSALSWNSFSQSKISVDANTESVNYYKAFAAGAEEEFNIGTKTLTDLLEAQLEYESSRTQLIQNKANMIVLGLQLKYLLGEIKNVDFSKLVLKDKIDTKNKMVKVEKKEKIPADKIEKVSSISTEN